MLMNLFKEGIRKIIRFKDIVDPLYGQRFYALRALDAVPSHDKCCAISKRAALRFSRFSKLISWDFAIDLRGRPLLIEANLYGGELDFHQMCNGPLFGDEVTTRAMVERFYKKRLLNR